MRFICQACGAALPGRPRCPNYWCARADRGWGIVLAVGEHRGSLQRAIAALKYGNAVRYVTPLADLLARYLLEQAPALEDVDVLVPLPSNVGSRRQADHVALVLAEAHRAVKDLWPVRAALAKRQETVPLAAAPNAAVRRLRAA